MTPTAARHPDARARLPLPDASGGSISGTMKSVRPGLYGVRRGAGHAPAGPGRQA